MSIMPRKRQRLNICTVRGWYEKTPKRFLSAAKLPQKNTRQKALAGSEEESWQFLKVMDALGEKLGPLLFQSPYFNAQAFLQINDFLALLVPAF